MVGHTATTYCLSLSGGKLVILPPRPVAEHLILVLALQRQQCVEEVMAMGVDPCEAKLPFLLPASVFQACGSLKWKTVIWVQVVYLGGDLRQGGEGNIIKPDSIMGDESLVPLGNPG